jgi:hypothetical protein
LAVPARLRAIPKEEIKDRGDVLNLGIAFNPVRDYARVFGDFINYDARGEIHEIVIAVRDAAGKEIKRATTAMDADAYAKAVLHFDNLPMGTYTVRLECLAKDGKVLAGRTAPSPRKTWPRSTSGGIRRAAASRRSYRRGRR